MQNAPVEFVLPQLPLYPTQRQRLVNGIGEFHRIPGVHPDGAAQRLCTACEFTQDQDPRATVPLHDRSACSHGVRQERRSAHKRVREKKGERKKKGGGGGKG